MKIPKQKTNKKTNKNDQVARGRMYLRISLISSLLLNLLLLLEIIAWLITSFNNDLGLGVFYFMTPVYVVLLLITWGCFIRGKILATYDKAHVANASAIAPLILFFVVLPIVKHYTNDRWQCQLYKTQGASCQQIANEVAQQSNEMDNISYSHTHIAAYVPGYSLPNYTHYSNIWFQKDQIAVPYKNLNYTNCHDPMGDCSYIFVSRNDISSVINSSYASAGQAAKSVGKTKWGSTVTQYLNTDINNINAGDGTPEYYVTQLNNTYLVLELEPGTVNIMSAKDAISILNSVKRVN